MSKMAVQTTIGRLDEMEGAARSSCDIVLDARMKPVVMLGSALNVRAIIGDMDSNHGNVSLVCMHPPYLNALQYTKNTEDDLSRIDDPKEFGRRMRFLAKEVYRALEPGGFCAVLMGDVRKAGKLVPLGYETFAEFKEARFEVQDIIVKPQHHDRSSEFYSHTEKQLLLSHEYLFVLRKPKDD